MRVPAVSPACHASELFAIIRAILEPFPHPLPAQPLPGTRCRSPLAVRLHWGEGQRVKAR